MTGGMADLLAAHQDWGYVGRAIECTQCGWATPITTYDDPGALFAAHQAEVLSGAGFVDGRALLDDPALLGAVLAARFARCPRRVRGHARSVRPVRPHPEGAAAVMNPLGRDDLGKRVRFYSFADPALPMDEGEVIGFLDRPSVIVRRADGSTKAWLADMPHEFIEGSQP